MPGNYNEFGRFPVSNGEVQVSSVERTSRSSGTRLLLSMAPLKTFYSKADKAEIPFIPKGSSIECDSMEQVEALAVGLIDAASTIFNAKPKHIIIS